MSIDLLRQPHRAAASQTSECQTVCFASSRATGQTHRLDARRAYFCPGDQRPVTQFIQTTCFASTEQRSIASSQASERQTTCLASSTATSQQPATHMHITYSFRSQGAFSIDKQPTALTSHLSKLVTWRSSFPTAALRPSAVAPADDFSFDRAL